ncbi:MAG: MdtA/MuxA family multidrug efflux RND transporter periplasmic adaptor subunit, partial [Deltaproteobacteria bacterium]
MNVHTPIPVEPNAVELRQAREQNAQRPRARSPWWLWLLVLAVLGCGGYWLLEKSWERLPLAAEPAARPVPQGVPVIVAAARQGDMPVYLTGLGSVTAYNTVTVKSRVDGQLIKIAFREGQFVGQGDLLAEIDPRPFAVQLEQAEGQMARDVAQLKDAQINLARNQQLLAKQLIAKQQVDDLAAAVGQYEGAIKMDQGLIDNARLQLIYCHITAPISGRVGLRLVDVGNMVHATDQTGLLVITQVQPIAVLFTIPEDNLPPILKKLQADERLPVEAYDRAGQTKIATGSLLTVDNQIDHSTGTTRLKAVLENQDNALFPNQFVNVRLLLDVRKGAVIAPVAAIQRGSQGTFVYVVKTDKTVEVRQITVGPTAGTDAVIEAGLSPAEMVVVDGVDKLRAGSTVQI